MKIGAVILTRDEEIHINRCIESIRSVVDFILVADSYSRDDTVEICRSLNVKVIQNEWINYSEQFNWAVNEIPKEIDWILRIDADEYLTTESQREIIGLKKNIRSDISGVYIPRRMAFMGRLIRHGGLFPVNMLRLFRRSDGRCETRWMDEHIVVGGNTLALDGELIDDNGKSLGWWISKHNSYAEREVADLVLMLDRQEDSGSFAELSFSKDDARKRWIKENLYLKLPSGVRAFMYFFYRYVLRLGFLDGREGTAFHFLQGLWYRYLVDLKHREVQKYMTQENCSAREALINLYGLNV
ncbi:MAG: glycosyltransferase family 2 protein, partial [Cyanobacteria bacterium P01_F01_bin.3]